MKVRKAKQIKSKPEHDKFISDIVEQSKSKNGNNFPHLEHSMSGCGKPVVEYPDTKKTGAILGNQGMRKNKSHWSSPITDVHR